MTMDKCKEYLAAGCLSLLASWPALAGERVALVVGNAAYEHAAPLANPRNDAEDMAAVLEGLGFAVEREMDLDYRRFAELVLGFSRRTKGADAALFYYAGHGLQVGRVNYLLPVDVALEDEMQLRFQTVDLDAVLQGMKSRANLVFLDACRDNPFVRSVARSMGTRSSAVGRGLARVENNAYGGTFIAFATAAGEVADDGAGRNSPFTAALKQHIRTPGLELNQVLNRVRRELAGIEQEPWATSSLVDDFYFSAPSSAVVSVSPANPPTVLRRDPAEAMWEQIERSNNADLLEEFLRLFPNSPLVPAARARLEGLGGQPFTVDVEPSAARVRILNIEPPYHAGMKLPPGSYRVEASAEGFEPVTKNVAHGSTATVWRVVLRRKGRSAGERFRDPLSSGGDGPLMVVVPAGSFQMGSPSHEAGRNEDEGPLRDVTFTAPFAVGVNEVTVGEFRRFVGRWGREMEVWCRSIRDGEWKWIEGRSWRDPGYRQGDGHPVVCVNWDDARAYARWLSRETGEHYRLPSEAEWEYAARGGTVTARHWGDGEVGQCGHANGGDGSLKQRYEDSPWLVASCRDGHVHTAPVGSFRANGFGMHDVLGNVWEWTEDCRNGGYAGAPLDGSAWLSGDCGRRVLRGGSWRSVPWLLRSAHRGGWKGSRYRDYDVGFRVARTLAP